MNAKPKATGWTVAGVAAGLLLSLAGGLCGVILGGLYVKLLVPKTGMGWDQIADAQGGLMLGGLLGLAACALLSVRIGTRGRLLATAALLGIAAVVTTGLALTRPERPPSQPVVRERPFAPWFRASVRVGHSEDILLAVPRGEEPVPFIDASVWSAVPELEHQGWGPDFPRCRAEPSREDLHALLPVVSAAAEQATGEICRTPREGDLGIGFNITIAGDESHATIESDCLVERPALLALVAAIEELADRLCPAAM